MKRNPLDFLNDCPEGRQTLAGMEGGPEACMGYITYLAQDWLLEQLLFIIDIIIINES